MKTLFTSLFLFLCLTLTAQDKIYVHTADATNTNINITYIDHPDLNSNPSASIFVTHTYNPGGGSGLYDNNVLGTYYDTTFNRWAIYHEDSTMPINAGLKYNVYIAFNPSDVITHIASVANQGTTAAHTVIDDPRFNGQNPGPIAVMSHYFNPFSVVNNNSHRFTYDIVLNRRIISNESGTAIPTNVAFKILVTPTGAGTASFRHTSNAGNITGNYTVLDHPLLNNNPNATLVFSHYSNGFINSVLGVWYTGSRWAIYTEDTSPFPIAVAFDIIIAPNDNLTYVPDDNFETYLETHNAAGTVVLLGDPTTMGNGIPMMIMYLPIVLIP